jgi:PAS domain S-box-containing protein
MDRNTGIAAVIGEGKERLDFERAGAGDSEERFRSVFENVPFGMCINAMDGRLLEVNTTLCGMLEYSPWELLTTGWLELIHPDEREVSAAIVERLLIDASASGEIENRYVDRNGSTIAPRKGPSPGAVGSYQSPRSSACGIRDSYWPGSGFWQPMASSSASVAR